MKKLFNVSDFIETRELFFVNGTVDSTVLTHQVDDGVHAPSYTVKLCDMNIDLTAEQKRALEDGTASETVQQFAHYMAEKASNLRNSGRTFSLNSFRGMAPKVLQFANRFSDTILAQFDSNNPLPQELASGTTVRLAVAGMIVNGNLKIELKYILAYGENPFENTEKTNYKKAVYAEGLLYLKGPVTHSSLLHELISSKKDGSDSKPYNELTIRNHGIVLTNAQRESLPLSKTRELVNAFDKYIALNSDSETSEIKLRCYGIPKVFLYENADDNTRPLMYDEKNPIPSEFAYDTPVRVGVSFRMACNGSISALVKCIIAYGKEDDVFMKF